MGRYYIIQYRPLRKFNWFNSWRTLVRVYDGAYLTFDQPVMDNDFDAMVKMAERMKANPSLIDEHYQRQREIYHKAQVRRNEELNNYNKTKII